MEDVNGHSMQHAIQHLPRHTASDHVWEEIRWQLDKPLSASLPLHTAPETAWEGIAGAIAGSGRYKTAVIITLTALLLTISGIALYRIVPESTNSAKEKVMPESRAAFPGTSAHRVIQTEKQITADKPVLSDDLITTVNAFEKINTITAEKQQLITETPDNYDPANISGNDAELIKNLHPKTQRFIPGYSWNQYYKIRNKNERSYNGCATFHHRNTAVFMIADFEPEFFEFSGLRTPAYNFSVSSGYRHNRFSLTLGAGYTRFNGSSLIQYEYRTNELIYSYDYVDSVYVDPVTHETYFFTVKVDVYDSIDHQAYEKVSDRFTYLQVPLTLSYELLSFNKLSFHLQLTGTYHILQENTRSFKPFTEGSSRLISTTIKDEKSGTDYWSAGAGLALMFEPGYRLGLSLSPRIKYNSVPVKDFSEKGFVSYGINFGLYYKITVDR